MPDAARVDSEFFQVRCGDFSQRDDLLARKQLEKRFQHRNTGNSLGHIRHTIAQQPAARIKRMPRERIPQHEFIWFQPKAQKRAPDDCCCRLGETIGAYPRIAGAPRFDGRKNL